MFTAITWALTFAVSHWAATAAGAAIVILSVFVSRRLLASMTWARALAAARRWALPGIVAVLVAVAVWFAFQAQRVAGERDAVTTQLAISQEAERNSLAREIAARDARRASDTAAEAAIARATVLEMAVANQKGQIDALEQKYGATAVSDLTREHLRRLRAAQRPAG
jgi:hypothetical protein